MPKNKLTLEQLHRLTPNKSTRYFESLSEEELKEIAEPCLGEAHTNAHIDYCMSCWSTRWGWVLKPLL